MIVLGLLFILVAVGASLFVALAPKTTSQVFELTAFGVTVSASPLAMFVAGAASLALLGLGYAMIGGAARRRLRSRRELRELRREQATSGANTSAEPGQHSSRRDRRQKDIGTESSTDTSGTPGTDTGRKTSTETSDDASR